MGLRTLVLLTLTLAATTLAATPRAAVAAAATDSLPPPGTPAFARAVLERVDDMHRGDQAHAIMEMEVKTRHWTRSMSLESWSKGKDYSLVRILEPKKDRGTATLKDRHDLFTYLSNTGRTVKIAGAMMGGSWMGSHFTNDDLVHETRLSDDYDIKSLPQEKLDGVPVWRFQLVPHPNRPIVWGKVEVLVRVSDLQPVQQTFFDEAQKPVRRMDLSEFKTVAGRTWPTLLVMRPLDGSDEHTRITWKSLDFNVKLDPSFFSVRTLTSR